MNLDAPFNLRRSVSVNCAAILGICGPMRSGLLGFRPHQRAPADVYGQEEAEDERYGIQTLGIHALTGTGSVLITAAAALDLSALRQTASPPLGSAA